MNKDVCYAATEQGRDKYLSKGTRFKELLSLSLYIMDTLIDKPENLHVNIRSLAFLINREGFIRTSEASTAKALSSLISEGSVKTYKEAN